MPHYLLLEFSSVCFIQIPEISCYSGSCYGNVSDENDVSCINTTISEKCMLSGEDKCFVSTPFLNNYFNMLLRHLKNKVAWLTLINLSGCFVVTPSTKTKFGKFMTLRCFLWLWILWDLYVTQVQKVELDSIVHRNSNPYIFANFYLISANCV